MASTTLAPMALLLAVLAIDAWIYVDAKAQAEQGTPVVFTFGTVRIDTPAAWLACCLILSVVFIPLYLIGRRQ